MRKLSKLGYAVALGALGVLLGVAGVACGDDKDEEASAEDIAAVEEVINQTLASGPENADYFFAHVTDNLIETVLFSTREDCIANAAECIGDPSPAQSVEDTAIDGDTATATVTAEFGTAQLSLVNEEDVWKVDSLGATSDDVPEGAASVDLGLSEFAFDLDAADIPADGNFAFNVTNDGGQMHEVIAVPIPSQGSLEDAMGTLGDDVQPAGTKIFIQPDQNVDMAFESPLAAGRYALVCFFPDTTSEEMTPHAELGMVAEFTVGEAAAAPTAAGATP